MTKVASAVKPAPKPVRVPRTLRHSVAPVVAKRASTHVGTILATSGGTELSTAAVVERVRAGLAYSELDALRDSLDVPMDRLAAHVGLSRATYQRRKRADGVLSPVQSDRVVRLARLMGRATAVLGGEAPARRWMTEPKRALGGSSPLDYADTEVGAREVENLLGRLEHGVFS